MPGMCCALLAELVRRPTVELPNGLGWTDAACAAAATYAWGGLQGLRGRPEGVAQGSVLA